MLDIPFQPIADNRHIHSQTTNLGSAFSRLVIRYMGNTIAIYRWRVDLEESADSSTFPELSRSIVRFFSSLELLECRLMVNQPRHHRAHKRHRRVLRVPSRRAKPHHPQRGGVHSLSRNPRTDIWKSSSSADVRRLVVVLARAGHNGTKACFNQPGCRLLLTSLHCIDSRTRTVPRTTQ